MYMHLHACMIYEGPSYQGVVGKSYILATAEIGDQPSLVTFETPLYFSPQNFMLDKSAKR